MLRVLYLMLQPQWLTLSEFGQFEDRIIHLCVHLDNENVELCWFLGNSELDIPQILWRGIGFEIDGGNKLFSIVDPDLADGLVQIYPHVF